MKLFAAAIARMSRACAKRRRALPKRRAVSLRAQGANTWTRPSFASAVRRNGWMWRQLFGAGEGIRTLDPNLGKVVLYP
ncbi:MAG: hypothetical protein CR217_13390 [Beijerinckiaceae bacterium]|nr:MAG: hypothetical protein CR217_13390 [Beijerinckiaceae bacterium]